jgi:ketosteroid isomerase-like protein
MSSVAGQTEEVVRAYVDACNGDEVETVLGLLHPEIELHEADTLPGAVSAVGFEEVRRYLERFDTHWSSFNWEPLALEFAGDRALMRARLRLVGRKSGIEVDREWIYVFAVRDGKLARQDGFDQMDDARAAFGHGGAA